MHVLAIDIGTSSVKAAVLETETARPAGPIARTHYALDCPTPEAAEIPADRLWQAVTTTARQATQTCPNVQAVGLAAMTPALVLLDEADRPVAPIWTHLDRRARPAARFVWAAVGEEFLATVGNRPLPGGISAVCWKQQVMQDSYLIHKVKSYLHVNGWLAYHMTGERGCDPANASFSGLFNTTGNQQWSERWCEFFEVDPDWLPQVVCGSATVGTIRPGIAAELNVPGGVPLKLGTADTSSAMLCAGTTRGDLLHTVGTSQVLAQVVDRPAPHPRRLCRRLGVGRDFIHVTHNPVGGGALDWFRELCFHEQTAEQFFNETVPQALKRQTKVNLDPPYLGGDRLEIEAHRASFRDLTIATDRLDLLAGLLDAMVRCHGQAVRDLGGGESIRRVFLTGGGAGLVRQLIPEYGEVEVVMVHEAALCGIARLFQPVNEPTPLH